MARLTNPFRSRIPSPASSAAQSVIVVDSSSPPPSSPSTGATSMSSEDGTRHDHQKPLSNLKRRHSTRPEDESASIDATSAHTTTPSVHNTLKTRKSIRTISGETLVEGLSQSHSQLLSESIKTLDMEWSVEGPPSAIAQHLEAEKQLTSAVSRKSSRLSRLISVTTTAVSSVGGSILGKRGREAEDRGRGQLERISSTNLNKRASLRPRSVATETKVVATAVVEEDEGPAKKKLKRSFFSAPNLLSSRKREAEDEDTIMVEQPKPKKRWLTAGLYVGQDNDFNAGLTGAQNRKKRASTGDLGRSKKKNKALPMPMFTGEALLQNGRPFKLPFDVYSPLPNGGPKPEQYRKTQSNRFVGDAKSVWKKVSKLPDSLCVCTDDTGCDENCLNRVMGYECDSNNCAVGQSKCYNRQFTDLQERMKTGRKFDVGVEVVKTESKGFGVRSSRCFSPGQIIVEYAGEIITQEECDRRVRNEYKKNECFYLMEFAQNMILDATRGSIARFINHSCDPNCVMEKWTVAGTPRMALFAGPKGVMTGEELTYDYNFDPFSNKKVQTCHCGTEKCRGTLGPKRKA